MKTSEGMREVKRKGAGIHFLIWTFLGLEIIWSKQEGYSLAVYFQVGRSAAGDTSHTFPWWNRGKEDMSRLLLLMQNKAANISQTSEWTYLIFFETSSAGEPI